MLVYDVAKKSSFEALSIWLNEIDMYSTYPDVIKLLVGNKVDKEKDRAVSKEEGQRFAKEKKMLFMECSAKTKLGIQLAFEELVQKVNICCLNQKKSFDEIFYFLTKILDTPSLWDERPKGTKLTTQSEPQTSESYGCGGWSCVI